MVNRIFDKKNVILLKVNEDDLNTFLVDMDIDDEGNPKYCLDDFTKAICNTIPEYVFAQYEDPNIPQNDIVEKLREAAHCIYKIKDFQLMKQWCVDKDINAYNELKRSSTAKRGEFGELLLHLILREFKHTIPLISNPFTCLDSLFNVGAAEPLDFLLVNLSAPERFSAVRANQHSA